MKEYIFKQYLDNILKHMDISIEDFFEKSKKNTSVIPRQILYYICYEKGMGVYDIESYIDKLGYKVTHTTILYGIKKAEEILENDTDYKYIVKKLEKIEL